MSTATKKPPAGAAGAQRPPTDQKAASPSPPRAPSRSSTPTASATNGVTRTRSLRGGSPLSARGIMQRPGAGASNLSTSTTSTGDEDDARAETVALLDELKERLRKTETISEQFQKQTQVLQSRLDEALHEQGKLEDRLHESEERLETLENEKRDALRLKREMESIYEAERSAMTKEREESANREEEMQIIIQRLKDSLTQRSTDEESRLSRRSNNSSPSIEGQFAPPSGVNRSDSKNNSKLLLQKDRLIESLRLELAEAQIKLVETENMGGGRFQEVERLLLEARMTNARLMEDNESYQLLLTQKTFTGDFHHAEFMGASSNADALNALEGRSSIGGTTLADELSQLGDNEEEADHTHSRRLEADLKASKAENKALTLYINKIIERLLQHQDFEAILDQSSDFKPASASTANVGGAGAANTDKDLPPPPPPKESTTTNTSGSSILQRAKSVAISATRRPRPQSQMPAAHSALTDPDTAPSIPFGLNRSSSFRSGRPKSEQYTGGAASVVNQMYRGNGGQTSPPMGGPQTPRQSQSFFAPVKMGGGNPNAAARIPSSGSASVNASLGSSGNFPGQGAGANGYGNGRGGNANGGAGSEGSETDGEVNTPGNSPPRKVEGGEKGTATTFAGNKPRPLRLVQDHPENSRRGSEDLAGKRSSWMGWAAGAWGAGKREDEGREGVIME